MRRRLVLAFVIGGAGCTLFLDTGGFEGETPGEATDASTTDTTVTPPEDAPSSTDAPIEPDSSSPDAADAGSDALSPLVGDCPFDEGSGTVIGDKSGRSHDGLAFGGVWIADRDDAGASALLFDGGPSGQVLIAGDSDFDRPAGARFSMSLWARVDGTPDHHIIFSVQYGTNSAAYGIEVQSPTLLNYWDAANHVAVATVPDVVGAWHHYGIAVDGSQARLYFDGVRVGQSTTADTTPRTATQVLLGHSTFGERLSGAVDKARFFRVALTDAEMVAEKNR